MTVPNRIANGAGSWPDADKYMQNWDVLDALTRGNFLLNASFETWDFGTTFSNPADAAQISSGWVIGKGGTSAPTVTVSRESTTKDVGQYSMKIFISAAGSSDSSVRIQQTQADYLRFGGETVIFGAKVKLATGSKVRLYIYDGSTTSYSTYHTGDGTWQKLYVSAAIQSVPTEVRVAIEAAPADFSDTIYMDSTFLYVIPSLMDATAKSALAYIASLGKDTYSQRGPTIQSFNSGSGTYTTPAGARWIRVRLVGGGGGGGGGGTPGAGTGTTGSNTTFGGLTGSGGLGGSGPGGGGYSGGAGGAATGGDINAAGAWGQAGIGNNSTGTQNTYGTNGAASFFGPGGNGGSNGGGAGANAPANSGGGGGGAGGITTKENATGGGAGGYVEKIFVSPAATYSYAVGGGGAGGAAGTGGGAGGNGGSGTIVVEEFYN